uniref:Uncharacterized protein n=1 Tax=Zea mays TaxID=4577 RepID=A0A804NC59_MAIZE
MCCRVDRASHRLCATLIRRRGCGRKRFLQANPATSPPSLPVPLSAYATKQFWKAETTTESRSLMGWLADT